MKRIEASIRPHRLNKVIHALHELPHFPGFTLFHAHGQGHVHGPGGHHAEDDNCLLYEERRALVIVCEDSEADAIAELIARVARTGNRKGEGLIAISPVSSVLRIREAKPIAGGDA